MDRSTDLAPSKPTKQKTNENYDVAGLVPGPYCQHTLAFMLNYWKYGMMGTSVNFCLESTTWKVKPKCFSAGGSSTDGQSDFYHVCSSATGVHRLISIIIVYVSWYPATKGNFTTAHNGPSPATLISLKLVFSHFFIQKVKGIAIIVYLRQDSTKPSSHFTHIDGCKTTKRVLRETHWCSW